MASSYKEPYQRISYLVIPSRKDKAKKQKKENKKLLKKVPNARINKHHINFYNSWWKLSYGREDLLDELSGLGRYIACSRVSARPIFEFVSSSINPSDALMAFCFDDYYSFGIICSIVHIVWYQEKCSTMKGDPRYTTNSIWDTFPWPQDPSVDQIKKVAGAAQDLHHERTKALKDYNLTLRELYRTLEQPGKNPIKELHRQLDKAVMEVYDFDMAVDILPQLLKLNKNVSGAEDNGTTRLCTIHFRSFLNHCETSSPKPIQAAGAFIAPTNNLSFLSKA